MAGKKRGWFELVAVVGVLGIVVTLVLKAWFDRQEPENLVETLQLQVYDPMQFGFGFYYQLELPDEPLSERSVLEAWVTGTRSDQEFLSFVLASSGPITGQDLTITVRRLKILRDRAEWEYRLRSGSLGAEANCEIRRLDDQLADIRRWRDLKRKLERLPPQRMD